MLHVEKKCSETMSANDPSTNEELVHGMVREKYARVAKTGASSADGHAKHVASAFGYSAAELSAIPAAANMGLSCGNPTAFASLRLGEVVVDLGCGGGLDVFLAAKKVGRTGKAIGIDMTPEMIELAKRNAAKMAADPSAGKMEFHLASIEKLPLPDSSVDCIVSNCVINLSPDKPAVFREAARVLKPGGRLAISDIVLKRSLPPELASSVAAYTGCIAGAITIDAYVSGLNGAGFERIDVVPSGSNLNAYREGTEGEGCCAPVSSCGCNEPGDEVLSRFDVNEFAASVRISAVKKG